MNQYEKGKHNPDLTTVARLCKVLNVPVAFMYCDDDELAQVIASYPTLSRKRKKAIKAIIQPEE